MSDHEIQNLIVAAIAAIGIIGSVIKQFRRNRRQSPVPAPEPAVRRRLAPPQTVKPIMPPVLRASVPVTAPPPGAAAAYAFPELDLTLPGYDGAPAGAPRRRRRALGGGPPVGSPAWAANAVVAAEILGPPVSLRSGATLGAPHAF